MKIFRKNVVKHFLFCFYVRLMSLHNFLKLGLAKDVVEVDLLHPLTALEYEKWKDQDV